VAWEEGDRLPDLIVELEGFRLAGDRYRPIRPDRQGCLRSEVLGLDLGLWHGVQEDQKATWVRLFHPDGRLAPTVAEAERQRAESECRRAEAAEAEVLRLRALLKERTGES